MNLLNVVFLRRQDLVAALQAQGFFYSLDLLNAGLLIDEHDSFRLVRKP
jgi:hypothetical protein